MRLNLLAIVAMSICMLISKQTLSQDSTSAIDKVLDFPSSFFNKINQKTTQLEARLTKQTERYLQRLAKRERKLQRRLSKIDSAGAQQLFANSQEQYQQLTDKIKGKTRNLNESLHGEYLPAMDSLKTSLSFLHQNSQLLGNTKQATQKAQGALGNVNQLQSKLQQSEQVKAFIQQRKQQIRDALGKYTKLPKGISNNFTGFNKEVYYYSQQIREYRDMLKTPDKMLSKGLTLLNKVPAFKKFMQQHSEMASLFRLPDNYGTPQSLAGLQTRAQLQQLIQTQLANAGPNATQNMQQNLQAAQTQLNTLKDKIIQRGGGSSEIDMPDFKPNSQKTKNFLQRIEFGTNFQSQRANGFLPVTSDIGLSMGYKLNDKSIVGIGASYKMGWGKNIRNIDISHQGVGLRSFADFKIKKSFWVTGGYEMNYRSEFSHIDVLKDYDAWQYSGLIGVSKLIALKAKFFSKTKLQLLWDFLSYRQTPQTQPLVFRMGYNF